MSESRDLLKRYAEGGCEQSFQLLVDQHISLVYGTALRILQGDVHSASDVAQVVFTDLARMARKIPPEMPLGGWLYQHTYFVASKFIRQEVRRKARERQATELTMHSDSSPSDLGPALDDAIEKLEQRDRLAIVLRFMEHRDFRSVGAQLGVSEDAARMRVSRALDNLHTLLSREGIASSAIALGAMISTSASSAAPAGLALQCAKNALVPAVASGAFGVLPWLLKKKLHLIGSTLLGAFLLFSIHQAARIRELEKTNLELNGKLQQGEVTTPKPAAIAASASESSERNGVRAEHSELLRLRGEVGLLRKQLNQLKDPTQELYQDPRFIHTTNRPPLWVRGLPGMTEEQRQIAERHWNLVGPQPEQSTFPPSTQERAICSIHGLLMQCTDTTGKRFIIQKSVASGSVPFGHTNTLNGKEWVQAFTDALQNNIPEWWEDRRMRKANLVLLTANDADVLVVPPEWAAEFRDKGFSDFHWNFSNQ